MCGLSGAVDVDKQARLLAPTAASVQVIRHPRTYHTHTHEDTLSE